MDAALLAVIAVIALALLFDFSNGFHDAANSIATVVATRAMPARWAPWFAAAFNFAAFFVVGTAVADTVAKVVAAGAVSIAVVFAAVLGAITWNYLTWWLGMPSSSSHALIGGLVGAGLSAGGLGAISWGEVEKVAVAIVASPLAAFLVAAVATRLITGLCRRRGWGTSARPWKALQLVSAAAVSFGHGANDAQKTMGVIAALLVASGHLQPGAGGVVPVPDWVALLAYAAIALGTVWGGWRIIETMGLRITALTASTGVGANVGATTAIFGATGLGIPISTTQAAAASVTGAGVGSRVPVDLRVVGEMGLAWVLTVPATVSLGWTVHRLTQLPGAAAWLVVGLLVVVLGAAIGWLTAHATTADEVAAEIPPESGLATTRTTPLVEPAPHERDAAA